MSEGLMRTRRYVPAEPPVTATGPLPEGALRYEEDVQRHGSRDHWV